MNIHDRSSLLLVPSGYKDGKLYSQVPNSGDGDFTFTRGSNLAATRVGADGLIEKGRENTLLNSNAFARDDSYYTITNGEQGYDGTTDAWLVNKLVTSNAYFGKNSLVYTGIMTISFYAKAGTLDRIFLFIAGDSARFDLENVTATKVGGAPIAQTIELVSGTTDWYRCSITINKNETNNLLLKPQNSSNQDAAGTIYIQDAQLEVGLAATDYIESGATTGKAGILENQPRLDYSGGASRASLLLEPQRTNIIESSEYLTSVDSDLTQSVSDVDSPILGVPYLKLLKSNSGVARIPKTASAGVYTYSVFGKQGSTNGNIIQFADSYYGFSTLDAEFNLTTGSFTETPSGNGLIDYGFSDFGNGSYRVWVTYNHDSASTGTEVRTPAIFLDNNELNVGEYIYLTGFQVEEGNYPTSYIPTYGASATRSSETAAKTIPSLVDTNSCTMLVEVDLPQGREGSANFVQLNGNSTCGWKGNYTPSPIIQLNGSGTISDSSTFSLSTGVHKLLFKWYNGTAEIFIDGVKQSSTITDSAAPTAFNGVNYTGSGYRTFQKQLVIFPTALSDTDCELLTGTTYESFAAMAEALNYTVYE